MNSNCTISIHQPDAKYRKCVGVFLLNEKNELWLGKRVDSKKFKQAWQMPQGGVDANENLVNAAIRELYEETGIVNPKIVYESKYWYSYIFPEEIKMQNFVGQTQKWFVMRVHSTAEVSLVPKDTTHKQEFIEYKWLSVQQRKNQKWLDEVIWFKQDLYKSILLELDRSDYTKD